MTKGELKKHLEQNNLSDDTEVLVSVKKYHDGEATWDEIEGVDRTLHGAPILIYLGKTVME